MRTIAEIAPRMTEQDFATFGKEVLGFMDGEEWSSDTLQEIAEYVHLCHGVTFQSPDDADRECANCGETVGYVSTRDWCDGCEEEGGTVSNITPHPADALIAEWERLTNTITRTTFPRLEVEEVTDDGETYMALRCPRCGSLAGEETLAAVDQCTRWNYADDPDDDSFDHARLFFNGADHGAGETLYYLHNDDHAVSLPDGWREDWG